jgi:hypothetical protein
MTATIPLVDPQAIYRIVVQPLVLVSYPDADVRGDVGALVPLFRSEVEQALVRRLRCYAPAIEVDWSERFHSTGPRGIAAVTVADQALDPRDDRLFDARCDAVEAIVCAINLCD